MSSPSLETTAYTPLETLLLFHNLSTHGIHPTSFSLISNILVRNPLVKNGETFDRARLAPDALREFYLSQLSEVESESGSGDGQVNGDRGRSSSPVAARKRKAKTPPTAISNSEKTPVVNALTSRLYEQYRNIVFRQIRDDEKRYLQLERDIEDISAGLWDERLLKEKTTGARTRSRSISAIPRGLRDSRASSSPGLGKQKLEPSIEPILQSNKLLPSVSVEVSPRGLPTPTPQHTSQAPRAPSRSPSQPLVLSRPTGSPIKLEQPLAVPVIPPQAVPAAASIPHQSPLPQTRDQAQEGPREPYKAAHLQTKRDGIKAGLNQPVLDTTNQTATPRQSSSVQAVPLPCPRQTQAHRALSAPIPSPQVPPKTEAVPPPPPNTSSPIAPPSSRLPGVKIEAPVPPPTRAPFPPITPRPLQPAYLSPQAPPPRQTPTISVPGQQQSPGHQSLSGLLQLADVADTRRQQQHTPSYPPHGTPMHSQMSYSPPGQQSPYGPVPMVPHVQATHRTPTPSTPGGGNFGILFPTPAPATPIPSVQQYPPQYSLHSQVRPIGVAQPVFQHYSPLVPAQQHNFEQAPPASSLPVQRIAPRPPPPPPPPPPPTVLVMSMVPTAPMQQPQKISPRKTRPPPINTEVVSPQASPHLQSAAYREPGSPTPPRPDEISPISTPSRTPPPPESPKPPNSEKARGKKRLFQEDEHNLREQEEVNTNKEDIKQQQQQQLPQPDRGREEKPPAKRQKSAKHDKTPGKKDAGKASSMVEKEPGNLRALENRVKDEEAEAVVAPIPAPVVVPIEAEPVQKPKGRGRPPKKSKAKLEERGREIVPPPPPKEKRPKRKRADTYVPTPRVVDDAEDSEIDAASASPTPHRRNMPKLEPQNSNATINMPSPSPFAVPAGQQPLVVATKKFLQLSAPLLGDISSHKFANLFSNAVNERMAPGYRNLVFRPQDLKSIALFGIAHRHDC